MIFFAPESRTYAMMHAALDEQVLVVPAHDAAGGVCWSALGAAGGVPLGRYAAHPAARDDAKGVLHNDAVLTSDDVATTVRSRSP